jgi:methionine-rich copper-binding protein CopC
MVISRRRPLRVRVPVSLIVFTALLIASVIAERARAVPPDTNRTAHQPAASRLISGRAVAFALTFDQIVSHSGSQLTLVTPTGGTRRIPIRLVAQPNTLYASITGLEPGDYRLQWEAQAADGTLLHGSLPFSVVQNALGHQF